MGEARSLPPPVPDASELFAGDGEAAGLMRGIDWTKSELGPPESWPQSMRALLPAMLDSRFAMRIVWGPRYIMLYNDAYRPILGGKHPLAMGRATAESYPELWHIVGPLFERVYQGETVSLDDSHLPIYRHGFLEECFFTLCYSPMRDDQGRIAGLLGVVHETTDHVLSERRLRSLRALAAQSATVGSIADSGSRALSSLADNVGDVPFALLYSKEGELLETVRVERGSPGAPEQNGDSAWPLLSSAALGAKVRVDCEGRGLTGGLWPEPSREALVLPLLQTGLQGFLVLGLSPRRAFDSRYSDFCDLAANQMATALAAARLNAERDRLFQSEQAALAEAQRQKSRLETLFEQAPAAICVLGGPQHVFEFVNPLYREMIGDRIFLGNPVAVALPELAQQIVPILDGVYQKGEPYFGSELPVPLMRDGHLTQRFFNLVYQPIYDSGRRVEGIAVMAFDVTDQVRARRKAEDLSRDLEATNQDLDQFAYVASHDLKAPLRGIANLSEWIEEALAPKMESETRHQMTLLRGRVHRLEALIDGILSYSRASRVREKLETVDTGALLHEGRDLLSPKPGARVEIAGGMPVLQAERVPLSQVFMNLMSNALKHSQRADPLVQITCDDAGPFWDFAIKDNGPGIAPQYQERIWGIFQTLQARDKVEGTGIGLSVVKKIVETRGGRVSVDSAAGCGATFHVFWPKRPREV